MRRGVRLRKVDEFEGGLGSWEQKVVFAEMLLHGRAEMLLQGRAGGHQQRA
jgi:hypothetical protein